MLEININPVFTIGFLQIRWITLAVILAVIAVIVLPLLESRHADMHYFRASEVIILLPFMISSVIGGKLFYILDNWQSLLQYPIEVIFSPFILLHGAVIGIIAVGITFYAKSEKYPFWQYADVIAPYAMLSIAVNRIGCLVNGCCYGFPTDLPWAIVYTNPESMAPLGISLHPTQLYHLFLGLLAFAILWLLRRRLKPEGTLFLLWLALFAITDLPVRFFRVAEPFLPDIQLPVLTDIVILLVAIPWLILRVRSARTKKQPAS
jgi:phosphatidylglycerol:prolipoprotein diacylglycerol transferase